MYKRRRSVQRQPLTFQNKFRNSGVRQTANTYYKGKIDFLNPANAYNDSDDLDQLMTGNVLLQDGVTNVSNAEKSREMMQQMQRYNAGIYDEETRDMKAILKAMQKQQKSEIRSKLIKWLATNKELEEVPPEFQEEVNKYYETAEGQRIKDEVLQARAKKTKERLQKEAEKLKEKSHWRSDPFDNIGLYRGPKQDATLESLAAEARRLSTNSGVLSDNNIPSDQALAEAKIYENLNKDLDQESLDTLHALRNKFNVSDSHPGFENFPLKHTYTKEKLKRPSLPDIKNITDRNSRVRPSTYLKELVYSMFPADKSLIARYTPAGLANEREKAFYRRLITHDHALFRDRYTPVDVEDPEKMDEMRNLIDGFVQHDIEMVVGLLNKAFMRTDSDSHELFGHGMKGGFLRPFVKHPVGFVRPAPPPSEFYKNHGGMRIDGWSAPRLHTLLRPLKPFIISDEPTNIVEDQKKTLDEWRDGYKEQQKDARGITPPKDMIERAFPKTASPALLPGTQPPTIHIVPHPFIFPRKRFRFDI